RAHARFSARLVLGGCCSACLGRRYLHVCPRAHRHGGREFPSSSWVQLGDRYRHHSQHAWFPASPDIPLTASFSLLCFDTMNRFHFILAASALTSFRACLPLPRCGGRVG